MSDREELIALRRLEELEGRAGGIAPPIPEVTAPTQEPYSGTILPLSRDEQGELSFDPNVGIVGMAKRAFTAPGEVLAGELGPQSEEGQRRAMEAAMMMTPMGAAGRVGGSLFAPKSAYKTVTPKAPTREELREATSAGYKKAAEMGVEYSASAVKSFADDLEKTLVGEARIAENNPEVFNLIRKMQEAPSGSTARLEVLDSLRKTLGELGGSPDAAKASTANIAQRKLDDFLQKVSAEDVVVRTPPRPGAGVATAEQVTASDRQYAEEALAALEEARGTAAAGFRSERVTGLEQTAARRTAAAASGRNTDNAIRQRLTSLIESRKGVRGFSEQEKQAIDDIIYGRPTKNAARYVGNLLGGGGGLGQMLTTFAPAAMVGGAGGGVGATIAATVPGVVGATGRTIANRMTAKELKALDELIRSRSPLQAPPRQVYDPSAIPETMLKALMFQSAQPQQVGMMQNALGGR